MKEITVTFWSGFILKVENIPKGKTVITRDVEEGDIHDQEITVQRWYFDGSSEVLYEGAKRDEKWEGKP